MIINVQERNFGQFVNVRARDVSVYNDSFVNNSNRPKMKLRPKSTAGQYIRKEAAASGERNNAATALYSSAFKKMMEKRNQG